MKKGLTCYETKEFISTQVVLQLAACMTMLLCVVVLISWPVTGRDFFAKLMLFALPVIAISVLFMEITKREQFVVTSWISRISIVFALIYVVGLTFVFVLECTTLSHKDYETNSVESRKLYGSSTGIDVNGGRYMITTDNTFVWFEKTEDGEIMQFSVEWSEDNVHVMEVDEEEAYYEVKHLEKRCGHLSREKDVYYFYIPTDTFAGFEK